MLGAEELLRARVADLLGDVHHLAAAVVAPARVALGVLVRQRRAERGEHRRAGQVLARDELQPAAQPLQLVEHDPGDLRVLPLKRVEIGTPEGLLAGPFAVLAHGTNGTVRRPAQGSARRLAEPR